MQGCVLYAIAAVQAALYQFFVVSDRFHCRFVRAQALFKLTMCFLTELIKVSNSPERTGSHVDLTGRSYHVQFAQSGWYGEGNKVQSLQWPTLASLGQRQRYVTS